VVGVVDGSVVGREWGRGGRGGRGYVESVCKYYNYCVYTLGGECGCVIVWKV